MLTQTDTKVQWSIDTAHSEVSFKVKHLVISTVRGNFNEFYGSVFTDREGDFKEADIEFAAQTKSINTRNPDRDAHLKSADFFDAEKFPEITFAGKSFNGEKLVGYLTMHGVAREIELDVSYSGIVTDNYDQKKAGFEIEGSLNRKDFGLTWSALTESGGVVVGDEVKISCNIQLVKM